jgi:hypothetical protein
VVYFSLEDKALSKSQPTPRPYGLGSVATNEVAEEENK